jgi:hypothetical protein
MKFRAAILAALLLLWAMPAFSQGCAMCYSTAKATSKDGQRAISKGVVVLLVHDAWRLGGISIRKETGSGARPPDPD